VPTSVVCVVSDVFGHSIGAPLIILFIATPRWTVAASREGLTPPQFPPSLQPVSNVKPVVTHDEIMVEDTKTVQSPTVASFTRHNRSPTPQ